MNAIRAMCCLILAGVGSITPVYAQEADHSQMDHSQMDHSKMDHSGVPDNPKADENALPTPLPEPTEADRAAAFPVLDLPHEHGSGLYGKLLFDRLEAWQTESDTGMAWNVQGWYGSDLNRAWLRSEGESWSQEPTAADLELLYGRSISAWWDAVAGVRHDFGPGGSQDFFAVGLIGVTPYKFEFDATAYFGSGQNALRLELEYETLFSARWILQSSIEAGFYSADDAGRGIGQGLNTVEAGFRLRYEIVRRFAPYAGVVWEQAFGQAADYRQEDGENAGGVRWVAGFRMWF